MADYVSVGGQRTRNQMGPTSVFPGPRDSPLALLFTDARGQVVFVDNNFLKLMSRAKAGRIVGEPLHRVLGLDQEKATQLMQDVARVGYVHQRALSLRDANGATVRALCTGVATYDDHDIFIGADITLQEGARLSPANRSEARPAFHGDSLNALVRQIHAEARTLEDHTLLYLYFTAQLSALQILLARMGGLRIRDTLVAVIGKAARRGGWPIDMVGGQIGGDPRDIDPDAYRTLLGEAFDYAVGVIGRRMVVQEMQAMDEQTDASWRDAAGQFGLRQFWADKP